VFGSDRLNIQGGKSQMLVADEKKGTKKVNQGRLRLQVMGQFKKHVLPQRRKVAKKTAASFGFSWRLCVFAGGS
jgi:hypothetical protein